MQNDEGEQPSHHAGDAQRCPSRVRAPQVSENLTNHSWNKIEGPQLFPIKSFRQRAKYDRRNAIDASVPPAVGMHEERVTIRHHSPASNASRLRRSAVRTSGKTNCRPVTKAVDPTITRVMTGTGLVLPRENRYN